MALPALAEVGRLAADPEMRFTSTGMAVCKVRLVFSARRKNPQTQDWEDGDTLWLDATAFKQLAENIAECLHRGDEVIVKGRLKTEEWQDKESGQKRSKQALLIDAIGPNLSLATAKVQRMQRSGGPGSAAPGGGDDPWASASGAAPGGQQGASSGFDAAPPF